MPTKITNLTEADAALDALLSFICAEDTVPCTNLKSGKACTRQHEGFDKDGRPLFWFGVDCRLPAKHFCRACLAYWLVAVARNVIIELAHIAKEG